MTKKKKTKKVAKKQSTSTKSSTRKKKTTKRTTKKPTVKKSAFAKSSAYAKSSADKSAGKKKATKKIATKTKKLTLVGVVTHYYDKIKVAIFKVKSPIQVGQKLRFTNTNGIIFEQPIISMQINHEIAKKVKKGAIIGMKVKKQVHENNKVYLIK